MTLDSWPWWQSLAGWTRCLVMNKILSDIAKEALVEHCISHVRLQAFAELIVRECADIATINAHQWESPGSYVLKHFGLGEDEFKLGSLADADAFAKKRNYHYTNTDNPIDFPDEDPSNSR